jgi:hypothetical protein
MYARELPGARMAELRLSDRVVLIGLCGIGAEIKKGCN